MRSRERLFCVLFENDFAFDLGTACALNLRTALAFYSGAALASDLQNEGGAIKIQVRIPVLVRNLVQRLMPRRWPSKRPGSMEWMNSVLCPTSA
jgi:hypothetical protein